MGIEISNSLYYLHVTQKELYRRKELRDAIGTVFFYYLLQMPESHEVNGKKNYSRGVADPRHCVSFLLLLIGIVEHCTQLALK